MKNVIFLCLCILPVALFAADMSRDYSRDELDRLEKEALIGIIIDRQDRDEDKFICKRFDPFAVTANTSLLSVLVDSTSCAQGSLLWPNGQFFLKRNKDYRDDGGLFYPSRVKMFSRNAGYRDDYTLYWPGGNKLLHRDEGADNDGTVFHSNGTRWLTRDRGSRNDMQRSGSIMEQHQVGIGERVIVRLEDDGTVWLRTVVRSKGLWRLTVDIFSINNSVSVEECVHPDPH